MTGQLQSVYTIKLWPTVVCVCDEFLRRECVVYLGFVYSCIYCMCVSVCVCASERATAHLS